VIEMVEEQALSSVVKDRVRKAARQLGAADPLLYVGELLERSFPHPVGDPKYAANTLTPGAAPFEPSFSEREPHALRFTIEPLGPGPSPVARREEATREMRRLVGPVFGNDALRWFDERSEEWRGLASLSDLEYGAWFGSGYDRDGLTSAKVYYELQPHHLDALPPALARIVKIAREALPGLVPAFTSIACRRDAGGQRVTFMHRGVLRLSALEPLLRRLGLAHHLPALMQLVGVALGGRFELPERTVLLGFGEAPDGPELKLEALLGMLPDVPPTFLDLVALGLSERPRELRALARWLRAFTPESKDWPGNFSVFSIRTSPRTPPRVSLYLRPVEFEVHRRVADVPAMAAVS
jgi:hypothetical protein